MKKALFAAAAVLTTSISIAQTDSTRLLDEVIITANKLEQKQSTTGKVVSVITKELIDQSAARTVAQLLNEQAGVTINGSLNNAGTNLTTYVRGSASGRALILVDGIPAYDPSLINNEFDLNLISLNNVERIEISRGAQSTIYGSDAIGGVINIITVPTTVNKPLNVSATLTAGSFGTFRNNAQVYGKVNRLLYNVRYGRIDSKGFSAAYDEAGDKGYDKDGFHSNDVNALLQYDVSPSFTVKSFFRYNRFRTDVDASAFNDEKDWTNKSSVLMAGAGFRFKKDRVTVNGIYQYTEGDRLQVNDSMDIPGFTKYSRDEYFAKTQYLEAYATVDLGSGFTWLQGADYRWSAMNNKSYSLSVMPPGPTNPWISAFDDTIQSQASLYSSLLYHTPDSRLNVELGGRMNVHSRYGNNGTYTFNPSFSISKHLRVFGSIATAFKAPSIYQLYSTYGDPALRPETSRNYEFGIQQQHGRFSNRVVYFHRLIRNGIDFNNVGYFYYNFNKQRVNGIEWEGDFRATDRLRLTVNYAYLDPREESQSRKTFADTSYDHLLRRANHNINFRAGYTFDRGLFVSVAAKYVGKRFDTGGYMADDVEMDSYLLLSAYAEYRFKRFFKVFADVQNLTDKRFFDVRGYNSIPFQVTGGISFQL